MPDTDLTLLSDAARAAGEIAQRYWRNAPQTWDKPDQQGPVTQADLEIDAMLAHDLRAARPDYGWLSEESDDDQARLAARRVFIIDPLDGTRAFIQGDRAFSHVLAVAEAGRIVAAVVYLPLLERLYSASLGGGAFVNGAPIRPGGRAGLEGASMLAAKPALQPQHWAGPVPELRRSMRGSLAYRMCLVAEGRFDAALTLRDSWEWDLAAGALILAEAGAVITDRHGQPMRFNGADPRQAGMLAANPQLHAAIRARLA